MLKLLLHLSFNEAKLILFHLLFMLYLICIKVNLVYFFCSGNNSSAPTKSAPEREKKNEKKKNKNRWRWIKEEEWFSSFGWDSKMQPQLDRVFDSHFCFFNDIISVVQEKLFACVCVCEITAKMRMWQAHTWFCSYLVCGFVSVPPQSLNIERHIYREFYPFRRCLINVNGLTIVVN